MLCRVGLVTWFWLVGSATIIRCIVKLLVNILNVCPEYVLLIIKILTFSKYLD